MDDGNTKGWIKISVPKDGVCGEAPVLIRVPIVCKCGILHDYEAPNPQIGEWYTYVNDPCEHTVTYTSLWEQRITSPVSTRNIPMKETKES
jgi:hypothetical protein